ncbi:Txe/YoeB family addiction module toxin [Pedobacter sp. CFBP9032]|uniref:Txe/YoeB family addiction module toxin n=1 Tax=Pedobacter sp. CFBP9032 TaxID=3096539 RepID=UPI002A699784|nr:Txe/YoeB family addiction module toxin [Pedobacter sp. CFBP9032]MDY0906052.1 Txe/YoeB family addiction module toxin [Pedobacter sp. CFBP9032]
MEIEFTLIAMQDLNYFKKSGNKTILKKIRALLENIQESPYVGIGKPEALKYEQSGNWSRRISQEHRLIYEVQSEFIIVHSLRGHYR